MRYEQFVRLVSDMRDAQRDYDTNKTPIIKKIADDSAKKVDRALTKLVSNSNPGSVG